MVEELPDYSEGEGAEETKVITRVNKAGYTGLHSAGFSMFLMKDELMNAIQECGFEHPSEVQQ